MKTKLAILITALTLTGIASAADNGVKVIHNSKGNVIGVQHADAKPLFGSKSAINMVASSDLCTSKACCAKK